MSRRINPLLLIGFIGMLTIGPSFFGQVYRAFFGDRSIWWTPNSMMLSLDDTRETFALSIKGKTLQEHLGNGTLFTINRDGEQYQVAANDIGVRLNNWDKVKASILANAVMSGFVVGITMTLFSIGLFQVIARRKSPPDND